MNTRAGLRGNDAPLIPTFGSHGHTHANAGGDADEIAKLRVENARLQQIVAELLISNQQLRRRLTEAGGAQERSGGTASPQPYRHDS